MGDRLPLRPYLENIKCCLILGSVVRSLGSSKLRAFAHVCTFSALSRQYLFERKSDFFRISEDLLDLCAEVMRNEVHQ